jgi:ATP-dependent RNA helicase DHX57
MGKSKKKDSGATAIKKCTCDHPFQHPCECGNRPERPSRGHKWDRETQAWGGKGHKQKGASGQIAQKAESATTTSVGKTQVAQWQRLPSQLLQDFCKREKRPNAKFKDMEKGSIYKYRCIVPDRKDDKKDLFFVPSRGVSNEEQAKEEAALLALLSVTPSLPHERKLPEPYKTTWLNAVASIKQPAPRMVPTMTTPITTPNTGQKPPSNITKKAGGSAQASTSLTMGSLYSSTAEKRKQQDAKRQERNARVRRHENIRIANQDHPVFMSAQIRKQIEGILRGDSSFLLGDDDINDDAETQEDPADKDLDDAQVYVELRLHGEGFTKKQTRTAYTELPHHLKDTARADEEAWDKVYEECLQWLLVHLNADQ